MIPGCQSAKSRIRQHASRMNRAAFLVAPVLLMMFASCSSDSTSPNPLAQIPDFIYVSNQNGSDQLFTYHLGATSLFPATIGGDRDPQSAAGKVVFTSLRDGSSNAEIYSATIAGTDVTRLTNSPGADQRPSLSADGSKVAFISLRTGLARVWLMNSDGSSPVEVATGFDEFTPENFPQFSPDGSKILFTAAPTGTSQEYVIPTAGGTPTQITHEVNGAFDGSWSSDGNSIFYIDGSDRTSIHNIVISSGAQSNYVTGGRDVGQAACNKALCLVVSGAGTPPGDIYAYIGSNDTTPVLVVHTQSDEREPAILHP